ncbi:geranylgeranyl pyrophosphate synthase [Corynebacterium sp. BCW_4722]|nr:geranylgeranyl pyrophosphate synthase [Corynebacterium sp. BCW_4722]
MTQGTTPSPRNGFSANLGGEELNARMKSGLSAVEDLLMQELSRGEDFITDKITHLAAAGGKRFRPMMALLCAEFGPEPRHDNVIRGAVVTEMVHLATLYHDDVMDEAERRRGVESANERWSNTVAILAGDVLFAHASRLMSQTDLETVAHFADTFEELVTGQMRETVGPGEGEDPVEHYLKVIDEKTAVLIGSAAHLGSRHSGASPEVVESCTRVGNAVGMVFQIVDDIIDIFSDPEQSGKTPGTDLREGVFTLPVLYALEEDSEAGEELRGMLTGPLPDDASVNRALELLRATRGRERALETVRGYLDEVERELDALPDVPAREALRQMTRLTVDRVG